MGSVFDVPNEIADEYRSRKHEIDDLYEKMNNISDTVDNIRMYQKLYLEKVEELNRDLYGEFVEYIYIDREGDHSFRKRKISDGKFENYRDALLEKYRDALLEII